MIAMRAGKQCRARRTGHGDETQALQGWIFGLPCSVPRSLIDLPPSATPRPSGASRRELLIEPGTNLFCCAEIQQREDPSCRQLSLLPLHTWFVRRNPLKTAALRCCQKNQISMPQRSGLTAATTATSQWFRECARQFRRGGLVTSRGRLLITMRNGGMRPVA